ncbi:MAG: hypothetical protein JSV89_16610 [Spirochaetaceae bacterium]|nr:MAG: hypothetical protein JSV89_16610 [Spirochaetaceae bacterium]
MLEFDYFRRSPDAYRPRTPNTAMRAVEANLLPIEACVYLGTSIKPLDEEPIDLDAIDRVLSRPHLDLDTNLFLMRILSKLLRHPDAEVALFAAESINMIETRYTKRIEELKGKLKQGASVSTLRSLVRQYFELAQIHPGSIRNFYLREAFGYIKKLNKLKHLGKGDVVLVVRILVALGLTDQAKRIINQLPDREDISYLRLEMEVAFKQKDITGVQNLCDRLRARQGQLDEESQAFLDYWFEGIH